MRFEGKCSLVQDLQTLIGADIEAMLAKGAGGSARSEQEVRQTIGPLFERYMTGDVPYEIHSLFGGEISRQTAELSSAGLRLVLDVQYYHDHYNKTVFAEISEGWRDSVIPYVEEETDLVIAVCKDNTQLNRELISNAFYQAVDSFGRDAAGRINDERFTDQHRELQTAFRQEGL